MGRPDTPGPSTKTHTRVRFEVPDWSTRRGLVGSMPGRPIDKAVAVLVVDGDLGHWGLVADILRAAGYTVIQACPGEEASYLVEQLRFAAIVVDAGPAVFDDGSPAAASDDLSSIVVLSAVADDPDVDGAGVRRPVARLERPVSPFELVSAVTRAVGLALR